MRIIDMVIDWDPDVAGVVQTIAMIYPCWVEIQDLGQWIVELTITCRQEDVASIERVLAPYV